MELASTPQSSSDVVSPSSSAAHPPLTVVAPRGQEVLQPSADATTSVVAAMTSATPLSANSEQAIDVGNSPESPSRGVEEVRREVVAAEEPTVATDKVGVKEASSKAWVAALLGLVMAAIAAYAYLMIIQG